jgi:hypothetical protein
LVATDRASGNGSAGSSSSWVSSSSPRATMLRSMPIISARYDAALIAAKPSVTAKPARVTPWTGRCFSAWNAPGYVAAMPMTPSTNCRIQSSHATEPVGSFASSSSSYSFLLKLPIADSDLLAVCFNPDDESAAPSYLHFGGRAHKRVA